MNKFSGTHLTLLETLIKFVFVVPGILLSFNSLVVGQSVSSFLPKNIVEHEKYLFYLHGGVVTALGNNAINPSMPEFGPYQYLDILDSLRRGGFNVISENRKAGVDDAVYIDRISKQIDTLFKFAVRPANILIVGASAGSFITLNVSAKIKHREIKYVVMGGCWPDSYKDYSNIKLYGHFLSIIESSDPHGTCLKIFEGRTELASYKEIVLNMGLSHGFIYKGYKEWIDPIVKWFNEIIDF